MLLVFSDTLEVSKLLYSVTLKYRNFETCEILGFYDGTRRLPGF